MTAPLEVGIMLIGSRFMSNTQLLQLLQELGLVSVVDDLNKALVANGGMPLTWSGMQQLAEFVQASRK